MKNVISPNLRYNDGEILGRGQNSFVFAGSFGEEAIPVAVKRVRYDASTAAVLKTREDAILELVHPNVARLFGVEQDACFRYFALELCSQSLQELFHEPTSFAIVPSHKEGLLHLADGLNYIHSKGLVYFDVKPSNVLFSIGEPVVFKWADFGLQVSKVSNRGSFLQGDGACCWHAPEILVALNELQHVPKSKVVDASGRDMATVESDVFSLGMIYFSFLAGGLHMFGAKNLIAPNILGGRRVNLKRLDREHFAYNLVDGMTKPRPADRIGLDQVMDMIH